LLLFDFDPSPAVLLLNFLFLVVFSRRLKRIPGMAATDFSFVFFYRKIQYISI
jgi:hypothetical protein